MTDLEMWVRCSSTMTATASDGRRAMTELDAWHFLPANRRCKYTGEFIAEGTVLEVYGPLRPCRWGLHASKRIGDAMSFRRGTVLCRVRLSGAVTPHGQNKLVGNRRECVWQVDAASVMVRFAQWCTTRARTTATAATAATAAAATAAANAADNAADAADAAYAAYAAAAYAADDAADAAYAAYAAYAAAAYAADDAYAAAHAAEREAQEAYLTGAAWGLRMAQLLGDDQ